MAATAFYDYGYLLPVLTVSEAVARELPCMLMILKKFFCGVVVAD